MALRVDDVDLVRDRALVERFQEGDAAAFETLYRRYFARLARFCQKRVGDPYEAEEIAQEAFTRALRALPTFEGERRFYPWVTVIAGRLCVDHHRRVGRSQPSASVDLGVIDGGQEQIVDAVDVEILATALGRIAPRHRDVLDLREHHGWSYQRIAEHYDVSQGTVEALLFRARKALRREFTAILGGDGHWAVVPVLPVLWTAVARFVSMKAKVEAWTTGAVSALSGPAMAAAITVTAVSGTAIGSAVLRDLHAGQQATSRQPTTARSAAATSPLPGRSTALVADAMGGAGATTYVPEGTSGPADAAPVPGTVILPGDHPPGRTPAPDAGRAPLPEGTEPVVLGLDPIGIVSAALITAGASGLGLEETWLGLTAGRATRWYVEPEVLPG